MAVEIPVVINIDQAFDEAAQRVDSAIKPFKSKIENSTANIKLKFGQEYDANTNQIVDKYEKLGDLINKVTKNNATGAVSMKYSVEQWAVALEDAKTKLSDLNALQAQGYQVDPIRVTALRESITVLTTAIEQRRHEAEVIERNAQKQIAVTRAIEEGNSALSRTSTTMSEISEKVSALKGKLQNLDPRNKEWSNTAKEIRKATAELEKYEQKLAKMGTKSGSINRLSLEMSELERKWNSMSKSQKFDASGQLTSSAQKVVDKYKQVAAEAEKYGQSLAQVAGRAKPGIDATTNSLRTQSTVLRQLGSYASMYVSIFGLFRFVKQIRDVTAELEYQRVALGHLIQDEEYGAKLFEDIKKLAVESPFRITQLVTYTKQLAAYRIEQEKLFDTTKRLADISAGLGVDMDRLILAYGQVRAASVLRGQELRQFTEAGIPLVELLAEKFRELGREGTTTADVFKLISARAVPFSMIADIFEDLTDKGGMFYKMQEEQAKTLKGRWEKLKDAYDIALQSVGETKTFERMNNVVLSTLRFLANNIRILPKSIEAMTRAWIAYNAALAISNAGVKKKIADNVMLAASEQASAARIGKVTISILGEAKARDLLTKAYARQAVATNVLSKSFWRLTAAMLSNPISAAIAGIAALTAIIFSFRKRADAAANSLEYLDTAIETISKANVEFEKSGKLISNYEALANNTERSAKENQKLYTTLEKLRDIYPELANKIGDENTSIEEQIELLRTAREERSKQAILEAEGSYETAKKDLEDALALQADLEHKYQQAFSSQQAYEESGNKALERRWRKQTEERKKELDEVRDKIEKLYTSIGSLEKYLFPEKANSQLAEWQRQVMKIQEEKLKAGDTPVFTNEEIEGMESVYDLFGKLKKRVKDLEESLKGMREAFNKMAAGDAKDKLDLEIKDVENTLAAAQAMVQLFGFVFASGTSSAYKQDPFINRMQERIKFMQDFKKGYDDLIKYMSSSKALEQEGDIMLTRGLSLGIDAAEQKRAAADLSKWYEDAIKDAFVQAQKHGAKGSLEQFLSQEIKDTSDRGKALKDFQKLIQSLWDAKTDLDTSQLKKDLEDAIKNLSDEVKKSETVRNFYQDILGLTGDEELASSISVSVYGGIGQDFQERLQRQLDEALKSLDADQLTDELRKAFAGRDFETILKNIEKFPEKWQEQLKEMAQADQKYNADRARELLKALEQAKSYGDQRVQLAKETARRTAEIEQMNAPEDIKAQLLKQNRKKEAEEAAKLEYDAFKETPMYVELFADLDEASGRMLNNMRENLIALKTQWKDLNPRDLKELQSRINELDEQIARRNPFKALIESIKEYRELQSSTPRAEADEAAITANERLAAEKETLAQLTAQYEETAAKNKLDSEAVKIAKDKMERQAKVVDETEEEAKAAQKIANSYRLAAKHIMDAAEGLMDWSNYVKSAFDGIGEIVDAFAGNDFSEVFGIVAEGTVKTLQGAGQAATGLARIFAGDIVGGISDMVSGIGNLIAGIGGTAKQLNIHQLNKQIKEQGRLIENLEDSYDSLSNALDKAFGNERIYNFNKMMEVMAAEMEAYRKQAEAERAKGKKADEDTALGYDRSARELEEKMRDLRDQQEAFFAGSDLASSAEAFADAWLSAYQEFGDTSQAIEERMTEMVQNLMKKAALSGIAQNILGNWYDSLADVEDWNAQTIAEKWKEAMELVNPMVEGMQVFANSMQAEGISLRNTVGQFTGISRDIAGASEESINGLAAGINTQNFYMSFMPLIYEDVAQILTYMTGGNTVTPSTQTGIEGMPSVQKMVYDHLPNLDANINSLLQLVKSVISPKSAATATHYVSIK